MSSVGIIGLGTYLPPTVRTNDWWSPAVVAGWHGRMAARVTRPDQPGAAELSSGAKLTLEAMAQYAGDPFRGAVQRRVMDDKMTVSEMEAHAAREAIQRAGIPLDQIDVILTQTPAPEHLMVNSACVTHRLLGLSQRCLAIGTEAACNAFAMHLSLAQGMIASGQARYVLSIHSSAMTRMMRSEEPDSAWWGDGAAAVVIGPVAEGKGVLSTVHNANGEACEALALGVPGHRWWDDGRITLYAVDRTHTRSMLLNLVDRARDAVANSLAAARLGHTDVDFYASHQGTVWFTKATAAHAGVGHAKTLTTFPAFGNLNSVNVPLVLAMAEREGLIRDGWVVSTFAGGLGETWSSVCLRWGR